MRKVIIAGTVANALEWYDFALYGHFVTILSKHFFPLSDPYVGIIAAYSLFAAGFIMRPIGGVLFGYIGDKYGRRVSLAISIGMMSIPTALIGMLPTYETIGILAPILLAIIRLLQGASVGGAFSGCIAFLVEHSPMHRRGLIGSISMASLSGGMLLGSLVATLVSYCMSAHDYEAWGWRIPFLLGLPVGLVGIYIKKYLNESDVYKKAKEHNALSSQPLRELFTKYSSELYQAIGIYLMVTVPFYTLTIFIKSYMTKTLGFSLSDSASVNIMSLVIATVSMPIGAWLSDKYGRKPVLMSLTVLVILLIFPIFWMLRTNWVGGAMISQMIFAALVGGYMGPMPAALVELFPTRIRFTGVALSYNFSAALFGGTLPAVATWIVSKGYHDLVPTYIVVYCLITLFTFKYYYKESYRKSLA